MKPAGSNEEDTAVLDGGDTTRPTAVVGGCRLRQTGQKNSNCVGTALLVLECVDERGGKLEPPLDARVVVFYLADALERFVVRQHTNLSAP